MAIPATIIPIMFAAFAAYAFSFMDFRGKDVLFIVDRGGDGGADPGGLPAACSTCSAPTASGISGQFIAVWLLHTGFGMPLAIYTLRNYMTTLPKTVIESAKIDGATHFQTFWRLIVPMSVPVLAAFAILQFLWVWNDLLIAKLFLTTDNGTVIVKLQGLLGAQGQGTELLPAGAFISMLRADGRVLHPAAVLRPRSDLGGGQGLMRITQVDRTRPPDAGGREHRARALSRRGSRSSLHWGARARRRRRRPTWPDWSRATAPASRTRRSTHPRLRGLLGENVAGFTGLPALEGLRPARTDGPVGPARDAAGRWDVDDAGPDAVVRLRGADLEAGWDVERRPSS